jgi:choloylglycine hydrolase
VFSAFHILNQFDIPKGSVINGSVGQPAAEITEWTSVNDLQNLRWYFRTHQDQSIRMVDLKEAIKAAKGEIRTIDMEKSTQPVANVSTEVKSPKQASN